MTTINGQILGPDGNAPAAATDRQVTITLVDQSGVSRPGYTSTGEIVTATTITAARDGSWSVNLTGNAAITCDWGATLYRVEEGYSSDQRGRCATYISVPTSGGPYTVGALHVTPPGGAGPQIAGYLPLSGGTMTGPITLFGAPTSALHAATKAYVDAGGGGGAVSSVNGQTGTVVLTASNVGAIASGARNAANGVAGLDGSSLLAASQVPSLDASKIGSGTLATGRIPDLSSTYLTVAQRGAASGVASLDASTLVPATQIPVLDASKIGTGTLASARIPDLSATYLTVAQRNAANGVAGLDNSSLIAASQIPTLDASKIGTGTLATGRIPDLSGSYVKVAGGSIIVIPEGDVTTTALTIRLPTGDRTVAGAPDTVAIYVNTGTAGAPVWTRTGYMNEYGMPRVIAIADNQVPFKVKQHSASQSADLFQAVDISNNPLASIDAAGGGHFPSLQISGANAATDHGYSPADYGLLAWVGDPGYLAGSLAVPAGIVHLLRIKVTKAVTISNIVLQLGGSSIVLTAGQNFAALFDTSGNRLAVTADQSSNWATAGTKTSALTAPYAAAAGFYYVGILFNGSAPPNLGRFGQVSAFNNVGVSPMRFAQYSSGVTAMPSTIPMGSIVADATAAWWAGVS